MNRHQKKALSLAAAIANLSFSIAVAGVATYAWYYQNSTVTASNMSVQCAIPNSKLSWKVLKYSDDKKEGIPYTSSSTPNSGMKMFYLDPYDSYIEKKNQYSNVLLRAEINYDSGHYYTSAKQIYIDVSCANNSYLEDDTIGFKNFTSNISQFKVSIASYVDSSDKAHTVNASIHDEINEDEIVYTSDDEYKTATNYFADESVYGTTFVTVINNTPSKDRDNKIITIPKFDCGANSIKKIVVYLECSYDKDLVKYYLAKHTIPAGTEVKFTGDISQIYFRDDVAYNGAYVRVSGTQAENAEDEIIKHNDNYNYLIAYRDKEGKDNVAFDGGINTATGNNPDIKGIKNYIPVNIHGNRIDYNEVTRKSSWKYTNATPGRLRGYGSTGSDGYFVGHSSGSSNGMNASKTSSTDHNNAISYENGYTKVLATQGNSELRFDKTQGTTQFNYIKTGNENDYESLHLYKLNTSKSAEVRPTALSIGGTPKTTFFVGDDFELGENAYIEITYSDTSTKKVGTNECVFSGYDMDQCSHQKVTVTHTDGGYTVSNYYYIDVTLEPVLELDYEILNMSAGSTKTITAYDHNFTNTPTFSWTVQSGDSSKVTIASPSAKSTDITISTAGSYTIRCTATASPQTDYADCVITVTQPSGYTKVDSISPGDEVLIVTKKSSTYYYLPTTNGSSSAPPATSVTVSNNKITGNLDAHLFTVEASSTNWKFKNGSNYLYTTAANDGIRIGSGANNTYSLESKTNGYALCNVTTSRYTGIYNTQDWRSYGTSDHLNYGGEGGSGESINFYKKGGGDVEGTLNKIMVSSPKTEYFTDDTFTNPTVTAYYTNGTSKDVSADVTITGNNLSEPGTKTVQVEYTEGGVTKTTSYTITITQSTLSSIAITTASTKTYFLVDSVFSAPNLAVTATYTSTHKKVLNSNEYTLSTPNMSSAGDKTITISYTEGDITETTTYTIHVVAKKLTSLVMTNPPTKLNYNEGESFSASGATFKAVFNGDNDQITTEDTTITSSVIHDKASPLTTSDTEVTFSYTYGEDTETVTQAITVSGKSVDIKHNDTVLNSLSMVVSQSVTLNAVTNHFNSSPTSYVWTIDNSSIIEITSGSGTASPTIRFKGAGSATLKVVASNASESAEKQISITSSALTIDISETDIELTNYAPVALTATTSLGPITWSSDDTSVATVDSSGNVTAVSNGTCTITATVGTSPYTETDTCDVTVSLAGSCSVTITDKTVTSVYVGHTLSLSATCSSSHAITWSSSATSVATVSSSGVVTGKSAGNARITATCAGGMSDYLDITVSAHTLTITSNKDYIKGDGSSTATLTATNNCGGTVTWTSSDSTIASVSSSGVVTGKSGKHGAVTITAHCGDNTATKTIYVYLESTLTFTAACGGSGTADDNLSWTITSDAAESTYDSSKGIHYGTGKKAVSHLTLTSASKTNVFEVAVSCSGASGTSAKVSVKVNGVSLECNSNTQVSISTSNTQYVFNGSTNTGAVVVKISQSSTTKALYCKQIIVRYY